MTLSGKHALVTGAGRGIGAAIATALVDAGARVTLLGREAGELEAHAAFLRERGAARDATGDATRDAARVAARAVVADVTDEAGLSAAFADAAAAFGPLSILINNAGIARSKPFLKMDRALWDDVLAVNLTGTYLSSRLAAGAMVTAGWGRIVNVASVAGLVGGKYVAAYCASKHGVVGLTRALAVELAESGVTVNAVCPGFVQTDILDVALANVQRATGRDEAGARAAVLANSLQRRVVEPEEVASTVVWLCGDGAGAVTGQAIAIEASGTIS